MMSEQLGQQIELLKKLRDAGAELSQEEQLIYQNLLFRLEWIGDTEQVLTRSSSGWAINHMVSLPPHIEKLDRDRFRLVLNLTEGTAELLRQQYGLMQVPAPLDATEALVRAAHALAGVGLEMTDVIKLLKEKL